MRKIIPPKEDECLKNLMENEVVRRHFISQVTGIPLEEIRSVRLMNTFLRRRYRKRKLGIVDVLVELNDDAKINIEMQIVRYAGWDRRCLFYLAKMYVEDLRSGEAYGKLRRCINISILDFNLTEDEDNHKVYRLRDEKGRLFSDVFEVHIIELQKKLTEEDSLKDWIQFFNATSEEELNMIKTRTKDPGVLEAIREVKVMNFGKRMRLRYEIRLKEKRDQMAREEYLRQEGQERGIKEGIALGKEEGIALGKEEGITLGRDQQLTEQIRRKLIRGQNAEQIAEALEETPERIRKLMKEIER